jgi:hypothetical protein
LRAAVAVILGWISRFINVSGGGVVFDKSTQGRGDCMIEGFVKVGGDVSHVAVYIVC